MLTHGAEVLSPIESIIHVQPENEAKYTPPRALEHSEAAKIVELAWRLVQEVEQFAEVRDVAVTSDKVTPGGGAVIPMIKINATSQLPGFENFGVTYEVASHDRENLDKLMMRIDIGRFSPYNHYPLDLAKDLKEETRLMFEGRLESRQRHNPTISRI